MGIGCRSLGRGVVWALFAGLFSASAAALPPDGAVLVAEATAGTVANVADGGSTVPADRFAVGLATPMGLCVGPGDEVYVAEFTSGTVKIITAGGNFAVAAPYATGLTNPVGLGCAPDHLYVAEYDFGAGIGRVVDITAGGDFLAAAGHAQHVTSALGLAFDAQGRLLLSARTGEIFDVTAGGDQQGATAIASASGGRFGSIGTSLVAGPDHDALWDFGAGGDLSVTAPFAQLVEPSGVLETPVGIFAVSEAAGEVYDITNGGDFTEADPYATGLLTALAGGFTGMAYYSVCGNGQVGPGEECDDGGPSPSCTAECTSLSCGDGVVTESAGEECDDGGESADCDPDCTLPVCGDRYLNTAAGEQCDDGPGSWTCDFDCTLPECGDGVRNSQVGEECDDGGPSPECDADCTEAWCGDGTLNEQAGEACDDGNLIDRDGCSSSCVPDEPQGWGGSTGQGGGAAVDADAETNLTGGCSCRVGSAAHGAGGASLGWAGWAGWAALALAVTRRARRRRH